MSKNFYRQGRQENQVFDFCFLGVLGVLGGSTVFL
jgi:hypothetical protein